MLLIYSVLIQVRRFRESRQKNTNEEDDEVREVIFAVNSYTYMSVC